MPDAYGNFKPIAVPAAAWERVFGKKPQARSSQENQNRDNPPPAA